MSQDINDPHGRIKHPWGTIIQVVKLYPHEARIKASVLCLS